MAQCSRTQCREFAGMTAAALVVVFAVVVPLRTGGSVPWWPLASAVAVCLVGLLAPRTLALPCAGWRALAAALGWINQRVVLGVAYFGLVWPVGLAMRILGHNPVTRWLPGGTESYRTVSKPLTPSSMEDPY